MFLFPLNILLVSMRLFFFYFNCIIGFDEMVFTLTLSLIPMVLFKFNFFFIVSNDTVILLEVYVCFQWGQPCFTLSLLLFPVSRFCIFYFNCINISNALLFFYFKFSLFLIILFNLLPHYFA